MKTYYPPNSFKFLFLILLSLGIFQSCNKDDDALEDSVLNPASTSLTEENLINAYELPDMGFETRIAIIKPIVKASDDSFEIKSNNSLQAGEYVGYNYLSYDLRPIDSIGGTLQSARLSFDITSNSHNAQLSVFSDISKNLTNKNQSSEETSETVALLGEFNGELVEGQSQEVELDQSKILPEILNLILPHDEIGVLDSMSKEGSSNNDPILIISYLVQKNATSLPFDTDSVDVKNTSGSAVSQSYSSETNLHSVQAKASVANRPPDSRPSASTVSGNAPLKVQFGKGKSSDDKGIVSYKWYFRDGTTATGPNPTHTFTKPGIYKVILSITDEEGLENGRIIIITVKGSSAKNQAPNSRPSASTVKGKAPLKVQFGSSKSSDDKGIVSYKWYFMDGTTGTGPNPSHTFTKAGTYRVILSVKDQEGLENGRIIFITVTGGSNKAPDARPDASPASGNAPLKVQFGSSKSSDDTGIVKYEWDFKDGNKTTGPNPSHTFTKAGTYRVVMTATDNGGLTNARLVIITVKGSDGGNGDGGNDDGNSESGSNPTNGIKASSFGYDINNATKALKAAINSSHKTIIVDKQSGDWIVDPLNFNGLRDKTIVFEDGVVVRARNGAYRDSDRLFQLVNSNNIQIFGYGATLKMNKARHNGQQNHVLSIISSSNITVKGITLRDGGGDGIYISRYGESDYCRNIRIENVVSTHNQRQGLTVVSVDGLVVKNSTFSHTEGEEPGAGVDFESESVRDRFTNVTFDNCTFRDNFGPGILTAFSKTSSSSVSLDITFNNSYLTNNFSPSNHRHPAEIDLGMSTNNITSPIKGHITFNGLKVENSRWSAIWTKKTLEAYQVNVKNAVFKDISKGSDKAVIHIGLLGYGNKSYANMGGFTFENVLIDYDGVDPSLKLFGPGHGNWNLKNMRGTIRVNSPGGTNLYDNKNKLATTSTSSVTLKVIED